MISKENIIKIVKGNDIYKKICPRCGDKIVGYPALSRYVDVNICSKCGVEEAFESLITHDKENFSDWNLGR